MIKKFEKSSHFNKKSKEITGHLKEWTDYDPIDPYGEDDWYERELNNLGDYYNVLKKISIDISDLEIKEKFNRSGLILNFKTPTKDGIFQKFTISRILNGHRKGDLLIHCEKIGKGYFLNRGDEEELLNSIKSFLTEIEKRKRLINKRSIEKLKVIKENHILDPYNEEDWEEHKNKVEKYLDMIEGNKNFSNIKLFKALWSEKPNRISFNFNSNCGISNFTIYEDKTKDHRERNYLTLKLNNTLFVEFLREETEEELMDKIWSILDKEKNNKNKKPHIIIKPTEKNKFRLVKKFNEHNHVLDPYGEENWNDDIKNGNRRDEIDVREQRQGVCPICGSGNLTYEGPYVYGNEQIAYEVDCMDCDYLGHEIYNIEFDRFARR